MEVNATEARLEIIKKLTEQTKAAAEAQNELKGNRKEAEKYINEECESEEEVRSLSQPGEIYDYKKVQLCVEQRKNGGKPGSASGINIGVVKDKFDSAVIPTKKD